MKNLLKHFTFSDKIIIASFVILWAIITLCFSMNFLPNNDLSVIIESDGELFTAMAAALSIFESTIAIIPSIPGGKLGLANIIIL